MPPIPAAGGPAPWWRNRRLLPWLTQAAVALLVLLLISFLLGNLIRNLTAAGLLLTWRWLGQPAGFDISETTIPFNAALPYWRALLAGLANTLRVVLFALIGATVLGSAAGMANFSSNGLLRALVRGYVEVPMTRRRLGQGQAVTATIGPCETRRANGACRQHRPNRTEDPLI